MVRLTACVFLVAMRSPVMAADSAQESVTVVGTRRTGIIASGDETMGTTITAKCGHSFVRQSKGGVSAAP